MSEDWWEHVIDLHQDLRVCEYGDCYHVFFAADGSKAGEVWYCPVHTEEERESRLKAWIDLLEGAFRQHIEKRSTENAENTG